MAAPSQPDARALPELVGALPAPWPALAAQRLLNGRMETDQVKKPALPFVALLALASALGIVVAVALAGVAMLLAAPAYAGEGSLLLERGGALAEAKRVFAEIESQEDDDTTVTRVREVYQNPYDEPLAGVYVHRLAPKAVLERLSFAPPAAEPRFALLTRREAAALIEPIGTLGAGEALVVELEYRTRVLRRVLALSPAGP